MEYDPKKQLYNLMTGNSSYNAIGRNAGTGDNIFARRAKSIDNAIGTTGAAIAGAAKDAWENLSTQTMRQDNKDRMNKIAKKYGYNTYQDVWDARDAAQAVGDQATLDKIDNVINPELQNQANINAQRANEKAANYADYMQNNDVSKRINQDPGKFLGSAINTLSTATDVLGLTNGPISNAIQGGIEGIADELEQNGLQDFDLGRAAQNAAIGAASGAAVGALNKGLSNQLAKNGGNLFKGTNKITQGINDLGSKTAAGRVGSTLATGAARGALSGAVGGATGAGLSSALQGADLGTGISNALQGAAQGAGQGAFAGATIAGANMAINNTPGVGKFMQNVNKAQQDWQNSGDSFENRLDNTLNSGKSIVGNELAIERLAKGIKRGTNGDIRFVDMTQDVFDDINNIRTQNGLEPITERQVIAFKNAVNNNLSNRVNEGLSARQVAKIAFNSLASEDARAIPGYYENQIAISRPGIKNDYDTSVIGLAEDGRTSLKSIEPRTQNQIELFESQGQQKIGPKSQPGFSLAEEQPTSTLIVPQNEQNVNATEIVSTEPSRTSKEYTYRQKRNQKLLDQYGTIDKRTANSVRAVETVGQIADAGFEKPADVEGAIKKITGSDGTVNKLNKKVIANAGQINTVDGVDDGTTLTDFVEQQIRMNGLYGTNDGNAISTEIEAILNQLPTRRDGSITGLDNAEDAFDVVQMLEKHSANYKGRSGNNYATSTPYKEQKAAVIDAVASVLKDRIYDASDVSQVVTPEVISEMKSWYPNNKKWATWVDENIATAKSGADLRAAQAPFVRMGRLIDNTITNSGTFGSKTPRYLLRMVTSNPLGVVVNGAEMLSETPIGKRASAWLYDKLANRQAAKANVATGAPTTTPVEASNVANANYNPATQLYNAIGRTEGLTNGEQARTANYISNAVQGANGNTLESLVSTPATSATSVYGSMYGTPEVGSTTSNNKSYFQPTGDYWTDILAAAMTSAIDRDDVTAFGQLYEMYQTQLANLSKQSTSSSQKLTATQQRANAAMNSLERISQMTPDLAYNLSNIPIVGGIATLGGNDYEAEARSLAQQIGYMVSGANIKEEEAYNIGKAYVPQPWDNEQVRQNKLRRAYEIIRQYQSGYAE